MDRIRYTRLRWIESDFPQEVLRSIEDTVGAVVGVPSNPRRGVPPEKRSGPPTGNWRSDT